MSSSNRYVYCVGRDPKNPKRWAVYQAEQTPRGGPVAGTEQWLVTKLTSRMLARDISLALGGAFWDGRTQGRTDERSVI